MKVETVPVMIGSISMNPNDLIPLAIAVVVGVILMFGVKREVATFVIATGVVGALLTN